MLHLMVAVVANINNRIDAYYLRTLWDTLQRLFFGWGVMVFLSMSEKVCNFAADLVAMKA